MAERTKYTLATGIIETVAMKADTILPPRWISEHSNELCHTAVNRLLQERELLVSFKFPDHQIELLDKLHDKKRLNTHDRDFIKNISKSFLEKNNKRKPY